MSEYKFGEPWEASTADDETDIYAGDDWVSLNRTPFATRIIACVNALAGHYPARMEPGSVARLVEAAKAIARDINTMQPGRLESLTDDSFALFDPDEEVGLVAGDLRAFLDALRACGAEVEA